MIGSIIMNMLKGLSYTPRDYRSGLTLQCFSAFYHFLMTGDNDPVLAHQYFEYMKMLTSDVTSVATLYTLYHNRKNVKNLHLSDNDLLFCLSRFRLANVITDDEYKAELVNLTDKSEVELFETYVKYGRMDLETRKQEIKNLMSVKFDMGYDNFVSAAKGFLSSLVDRDLRMATRDYYFDNLANFFAESGYGNGKTLIMYMDHGGDDFDYIIKKYEGVVSQLKEKQ